MVSEHVYRDSRQDLRVAQTGHLTDCLSLSLCVVVQQINVCSHVSIDSSSFTRVAAVSGGAIAVEETANLEITYTTFNSVYAKSRGGQFAECMQMRARNSES